MQVISFLLHITINTLGIGDCFLPMSNNGNVVCVFLQLQYHTRSVTSFSETATDLLNRCLSRIPQNHSNRYPIIIFTTAVQMQKISPHNSPRRGSQRRESAQRTGCTSSSKMTQIKLSSFTDSRLIYPGKTTCNSFSYRHSYSISPKISLFG